MIKDMIKALEGGRNQLLENEIEIRDIISHLDIVADKIDVITCNYSEVVLNNSYCNIYYGVMMENDDYSNFNLQETETLRSFLDNTNLSKENKKEFINTYKYFFGTWDTFLNHKEPKFKTRHNLSFNWFLKELDEAIKELKELC